MHIICLTPLEEGVYNDHISETIIVPPEGWAMIPEGFPLPSTFPRLGSLEAKELTYTKDILVEKEVTKTREIESVDEKGNPIIETEEYQDVEIVTEPIDYKMVTVTKMTEGTLPEPEPIPEPEPTTDEVLNTLLGVTDNE